AGGGGRGRAARLAALGQHDRGRPGRRRRLPQGAVAAVNPDGGLWRDIFDRSPRRRAEMITQPATRAADAELIGASLTEPEAFAELFDRYSGMLYRYVSRRLGPEPAEDLVGETFLVAFSRRRSYDLSYPDARPWLFGILTKLVSRHHRTAAARHRALLRAPVH